MSTRDGAWPTKGRVSGLSRATNDHWPEPVLLRGDAIGFLDSGAYLLKYIHAASANKMTVMIQRDESLIPVFLAMRHILP